MSTAVWFPRARTVELREEQLPEIGAGEIRVRAVVSGLSHGTEMLVYRGQAPEGTQLDLPTLRGGFGFPIKYGYASVGRVAEVGASVEGLLPGDLVFALHPHQTDYTLSAALAVLLQPGLPAELGVFVANLETAVNVLLDASPRLGERIVVFGQGVVGLLITQLLRRAGAGMIVAVDPLPLRRDLARISGADTVLSPGAGLSKAVRELTDGAGADIVVEASGNPEALNQALDCAAFEGTIVVSSWYGTKSARLALGGAFHRGRVRIISSQVGAIDAALQPRWSKARRVALVRELLPKLELAPLITHRIPFERAAAAYTLVDEHPEQVVQVVLTYP